MFFKIVTFPFMIIKYAVRMLTLIIKCMLSLLSGTFRFTFGRIWGTVFGALSGALMGRKHVRIKIFSSKK